jgi:hypothetical protein
LTYVLPSLTFADLLISDDQLAVRLLKVHHIRGASAQRVVSAPNVVKKWGSSQSTLQLGRCFMSMRVNVGIAAGGGRRAASQADDLPLRSIAAALISSKRTFKSLWRMLVLGTILPYAKMLPMTASELLIGSEQFGATDWLWHISALRCCGAA